jgi:hypothetical protein
VCRRSDSSSRGAGWLGSSLFGPPLLGIQPSQAECTAEPEGVRRPAKIGGRRIRAPQTSETQSGAWRPSRDGDFILARNFV